MELKVLQVRKKSDEEHNLPIGPFRFSQCEKSERLREMSKIPLNLRRGAGDIQVFYVEFLDVGQCAVFASGPVVEFSRRKYRPIFTGDKYPLDKGEETKPGCPPERVGPLSFSRLKETRDSSGKSAMEMRYSGDVLGARGEGACQEAAGIMDEMGNNHIDDLLREPGGGGRTCGSRVRRGTREESILGSWSASVPGTLNEQLITAVVDKRTQRLGRESSCG
jgi:hypothetical protein